MSNKEEIKFKLMQQMANPESVLYSWAYVIARDELHEDTENAFLISQFDFVMQFSLLKKSKNFQIEFIEDYSKKVHSKGKYLIDLTNLDSKKTHIREVITIRSREIVFELRTSSIASRDYQFEFKDKYAQDKMIKDCCILKYSTENARFIYGQPVYTKFQISKDIVDYNSVYFYHPHLFSQQQLKQLAFMKWPKELERKNLTRFVTSTMGLSPNYRFDSISPMAKLLRMCFEVPSKRQ